jgi:hypothetical protein
MMIGVPTPALAGDPAVPHQRVSPLDSARESFSRREMPKRVVIVLQPWHGWDCRRPCHAGRRTVISS